MNSNIYDCSIWTYKFVNDCFELDKIYKSGEWNDDTRFSVEQNALFGNLIFGDGLTDEENAKMYCEHLNRTFWKAPAGIDRKNSSLIRSTNEKD